MAAPAPSDTEDTRGRRRPTSPHTPPPSTTTTPPLPGAARAGRRGPSAPGAGKARPGRRGARPEGGGGREAVPALPRWSGPGTGERRGRRGEGRGGGEPLVYGCFPPVPVGNGARAAGPASGRGSPRGWKGTQK